MSLTGSSDDGDNLDNSITQAAEATEAMTRASSNDVLPDWLREADEALTATAGIEQRVRQLAATASIEQGMRQTEKQWVQVQMGIQAAFPSNELLRADADNLRAKLAEMTARLKVEAARNQDEMLAAIHQLKAKAAEAVKAETVAVAAVKAAEEEVAAVKVAAEKEVTAAKATAAETIAEAEKAQFSLMAAAEKAVTAATAAATKAAAKEVATAPATVPKKYCRFATKRLADQVRLGAHLIKPKLVVEAFEDGADPNGTDDDDKPIAMTFFTRQIRDHGPPDSRCFNISTKTNDTEWTIFKRVLQLFVENGLVMEPEMQEAFASSVVLMDLYAEPTTDIFQRHELSKLTRMETPDQFGNQLTRIDDLVTIDPTILPDTILDMILDQPPRPIIDEFYGRNDSYRFVISPWHRNAVVFAKLDSIDRFKTPPLEKWLQLIKATAGLDIKYAKWWDRETVSIEDTLRIMNTSFRVVGKAKGVLSSLVKHLRDKYSGNDLKKAAQDVLDVLINTTGIDAKVSENFKIEMKDAL